MRYVKRGLGSGDEPDPLEHFYFGRGGKAKEKGMGCYESQYEGIVT